MTPKENYLRMMRGEIPEFVPSYIEPYGQPVREELLTPMALPDGKPYVTSLGVTYVGDEEFNFGAMPAPNQVIVSDITKWRDQLKIRDVSGRDWEGYYKKLSDGLDRENMCVSIDGGDYFLTLASLMGFEGALLAMHEEPELVIEMLTHISEFYLMVTKQQLHYLKPDVYVLMDDDAAFLAPFFSVETYREIFKPFHKLHADLVLDAGCFINRHDCGKCEQFIDDWLDIGVREWNPAQISNDLKGIKKKYGDRLVLSGCWDNQPWLGKIADKKELRDALAEYVDTFAPGGSFTFVAMAGGPVNNPILDANREIVKEFYYDYVRDWYKTHS